jgi:hypothetical protein
VTLRLAEGFDYLPAGNANSVRIMAAAGYYNTAAVAANVTTGRFGFGKRVGYAGNVGPITGGEWQKILPLDPGVDDLFDHGRCGVAMNVGADQTYNGAWIGLCDAVNNAPQVTVSWDVNGVLRAWRGYPLVGGLLGTSAPGAYFVNEDWYLEFGGPIDNAAGGIEVRVNTKPVIQTPPLIDTQATGRAGFDSIGWGVVHPPVFGGHYNFTFDDLVVTDDAGDVNNTFLGNVRVKTQFGVGVGAASDFTPVGAASDWQAMLNTLLDDSKYAAGAAGGDKVLVAVEAILGAEVVHGVQIRAGLRQDDATQRQAANLLKLAGGATVELGDFFTNQTYTLYRAIEELNPDTGLGMIGTDLNASNIGVKVLA